MGTAPYFAYGAVGITGQTESSLDSITSAALGQNDIAIVLNTDNYSICFYRLISASGAEHNPPYVVKPYTEVGTKRWHLISQEIYTTNVIQLIDKYVQTSHIKALPDDSLRIETADGHFITINPSGTVYFPGFVSGSDPVNNEHFVTKLYADNEIVNIEGNLESYIDNNLESYVDEIVEIKEIEIIDYFDTNLKDYFDNQIEIKESEWQAYFNNQVDSVHSITRTEITTWTQDGLFYYHDITHNKGYETIIIRCWKDNEMIYPKKIESININTVRIWMPVEENIFVVIV